MPDDDVVRGEEAKLRKEQWRKLTDSINRQWLRDNYFPRLHLDTAGITHQGDAALIHNWIFEENHPQEPTNRRGLMRPKERELPNWMALHDMHELWVDYNRQQQSGRLRRPEPTPAAPHATAQPGAAPPGQTPRANALRQTLQAPSPPPPR